MKCRRVIGERHAYWNIKGLGHFVVFFCLNYLRFMRFERYHFEQIVVPLRDHSLKGCFVSKKAISRNFRYPAAEIREESRTAVKERGFGSEQAFLIAACEHEIWHSANT